RAGTNGSPPGAFNTSPKEPRGRYAQAELVMRRARQSIEERAAVRESRRGAGFPDVHVATIWTTNHTAVMSHNVRAKKADRERARAAVARRDEPTHAGKKRTPPTIATREAR